MDKRKKLKYNWQDIQKYYDFGFSLENTMIKFGIKSKQSFYGAMKRGDFKTRTLSEGMLISHKMIPRKHSEKTKKHLSDIRLKYLTEHPDKVPYIVNHSSKKSWPEEVFENALRSSDIQGWIYKYRNGIYEYDFAFPLVKLDVEIDGGTHKTEKVKKIDRRRDDFSVKNGWKVLRFDAEKVKKNVIGCINELKSYLYL